MSNIHLVIGNKNYSSWSLRPWVLMRALGIPFVETLHPFGPVSASNFREFSPTGKVPCLVDGDTVWLRGTKYRMEGYDTPEPQSQICGGAAEVALAHQASARLLDLLNGNRWTVDVSGALDDTGTRTLITILIDGRDVGDILIEERLARRWPDGDEWWCRL